MKLHRDRYPQQGIFFSVSLSKALVILCYYCLPVSAGGQVQPTPRPETTPLIPPTGQPSTSPTAEPQLPENKGVGGETKPLIPSIQSPTPAVSPGSERARRHRKLRQTKQSGSSSSIYRNASQLKRANRSHHRVAAYESLMLDSYRSTPNAAAIREPYFGDCTQ
jgi:hypothetical protein